MSSFQKNNYPVRLATEASSVYLMEATDSADAVKPWCTLQSSQVKTSTSTVKKVLQIWDDDTAVGTIFIVGDVQASESDIHFSTRPEFENLGYATLALKAVTKYAVNEADMLSSTVNTANTKAQSVLSKSGYKVAVEKDDTLVFEYATNETTRPTLGVIKLGPTSGSDGSRRSIDSARIEIGIDEVERITKKFSGKNRQLQGALLRAINFASNNPRGIGSEKLQSTRGNEPVISGSRVPLWGLKPADTPIDQSNLLRDIRIIYGVQEIDGILTTAVLDIIKCEDFTKKYK